MERTINPGKMRNRFFAACLPVIFFLALPMIPVAQQIPREALISAYIYNFAKNVQWQNEDGIREFNFLVLGQDEKIVRQMTALAKAKTLREKPIRVIAPGNLAEIEKAQLVFVTRGGEKDLVRIFDRIEGRNILLVTDNYSDKRLIMINFLDTDKGKLVFEINKANIINQHFTILQDLILLGGTEVDMVALYREGQQSLRSLQKHSENLEKSIAQQEKVISARTKEAQESKDSLAGMASRIRNQQKVLGIQEQALKLQEKELAEKLIQIRGERDTLKNLYVALQAQKDALKKGNEALQDQRKETSRLKAEIQQETKILEEQGAKIHHQKNLVLLLVIIIALIVILAATVFYSYRHIHKFSRELERKVAQRTSELIVLNDKLHVELAERMQAETSLRQSEERYRYLFERNPASMLIYDRHSLHVLAFNEAIQKHYGYSDEEMESMILPDFYPEDEKKRIVEVASTLNGHAYVGEWHHIKKDGSVITIIANSHDMTYMGKEARIAVVSDITERKKAEEALLISNKSLVKAQRMAHLGFLDWNLVTNEIIPSEEVYHLYGLPPGKKFETPGFVETVAHPDDKAYIQENLELALEDKKPYNIDHRIVRPDGEILWVNAQAELIRDQEGRPVRLLGTIMDITERKLAEENIHKLNVSLEERVAERTAQLTAINKELESFSYSISHDLRAPLRAIFGFSQILARRHRDSLNEEGQQYMNYIVEASIRMEQLISDLLQYSRLGRTSMKMRDISLKAILEEVLADLQIRFKEAGAQCVVETEMSELRSDESLLRQIFTNLIDNAIKYRRNEVAPEIRIHCDHHEEGWLLKITDNGIGIPEEYWEKIFNIFQRLQSDDQYPGTGIGLANVKKAVNLLNGKIWVESKVTRGSVFFIYLPDHK